MSTPFQFIVLGLLVAAISLPLMLRRVPPNPIYGLRVRATLRDREIWYDANQRAGRHMVLAGCGVAAVAALLGALAPGAPWSISVLRVGTVAVLVGTAAMGWIGANRMAKKRPPGRDAGNPEN